MPPITLREATLGTARLRLLRQDARYLGVVIEAGKVSRPIEGHDPCDVWDRLRREAGRRGPAYFGHDGARARFLLRYPGGFSDPAFLADERGYKLAAAARLAATLPLEAALDGSGGGEAALAAFRATNLVSPFEQMRIQAALRSRTADDFIRGAAVFALGDRAAGLRRMTAALAPHGAAKWTLATYLPFFWRPADHMFLKPQVTRDFAGRIGHPFAHDYTAQLTAEIYASLLDLTRELRDRLSGMAPRDNIDLQSFIWVVSADGTAEDAAAVRTG